MIEKVVETLLRWILLVRSLGIALGEYLSHDPGDGDRFAVASIDILLELTWLMYPQIVPILGHARCDPVSFHDHACR